MAVKHGRRGTRQPKAAYFRVLGVVDGLEPAKPIDYINSFFRVKTTYRHLLPKALDLAGKLPFSFKSKNPKIVAGSCIYISSFYLYDAGNYCIAEIKQRELSDYFGVTEVSIRSVYKEAIEALGLNLPPLKKREPQ